MKKKNQVKSLWWFLSRALCVLVLFGTVGTLKANTEEAKNKFAAEEFGDVIVLYSPAARIAAEFEEAYAKAQESPEDYLYNGDKPVPIYSSEEESCNSEPIPGYTMPDGREVYEEDLFSFKGKIKSVKGCFVHFEAENGEIYEVPVFDLADYTIADMDSKLDARILELMQDPAERCMKGTMDAQMYHGRFGGNFAGGMLLGVFWVIFTAVIEPGPQNGANTYAMSQNRELFSDPYYLECYGKKAKKKNVNAALAGWGTWVLIVLLATAGGS